jgi:hypothetical protein
MVLLRAVYLRSKRQYHRAMVWQELSRIGQKIAAERRARERGPELKPGREQAGVSYRDGAKNQSI